MRNRIRIMGSLLVLALAGCQGYHTDAARTPGEFTDDVAIQAAVKTRLITTDGIGGAGINVEVSRSVVTLYGRVRSETEREMAVAATRDVGGVASVVDRLTLVKPE